MTGLAYVVTFCVATVLLGCKPQSHEQMARDAKPSQWNTKAVGVASFLLADDFYSLVDGNGSVLKERDLPMLARVGLVSTAKQYQSDFDDNEIAADQKYKGKKLLLRGTVTSVNKDAFGDGYFTLDSGTMEGMQAHLDDASLQRAADAKRGDRVVLICDPSTRLVGIAITSNCLFLSQYLQKKHLTPEEQVSGFFAGTAVLPPDAAVLAMVGYALGTSPTTPNACLDAPNTKNCELKKLGPTKASLGAFLEAQLRPFKGKVKQVSCTNPARETPKVAATEPDVCLLLRS